MTREAAAVSESANFGSANKSGAAPAGVTINPATNDLALNPSDTLDESISVTIPQGHKCKNINLVPSASIAVFIALMNPPGGYGPITGEQEQTLTFRVRFHGIPCTPELQLFIGTLDLVCDGRPIAKKDVKITVPGCPSKFIYSVKFICGEQPSCGCECKSVEPGRYATEINIHNFGLKEVAIQKRFIPLTLVGAPIGREPRVIAARAEDKIVLPPQAATMDDCCRIAELLFGGEAASPVPITVGFLEITASGPIAVTAVYTATGRDSAGVSIEVEQIPPMRA